MYKLGLKLWSINTDFYSDEAKRLYEQGVFDYIELYVVPNSIDEIEKWKNLKIPFIIHCPHFAHGFNLAKVEKKESNFKIYKEVERFADELSAKFIIFHGGIDGSIEETAKQLANFNEKRALIENKPYIALPNRMKGKFCRGYSSDELQIVINEAKCGFCLDFGHAICAANSVFSSFAASSVAENATHINPSSKEAREQNIRQSPREYCFQYIKNLMTLNPQMFHLTDIENIASQYDSHPHLGTGQLNIDKIKSFLPDDAIITLETNKNSKENLDDFLGDIKCMRK